MTKNEFIDILETCLSGKVSKGTVQENISYYQQYFANEMYAGKSEEEICDSLGSPQLIAKGILEAEKFQSDRGYSSEGYSGNVDQERDYRSSSTRINEHIHNFRLPGWLMMIIMMLIFFFIVNIVITVFSALAPFILPICIVCFVLSIFKNNF